MMEATIVDPRKTTPEEHAEKIGLGCRKYHIVNID